jgi:hypothetical protein
MARLARSHSNLHGNNTNQKRTPLDPWRGYSRFRDSEPRRMSVKSTYKNDESALIFQDWPPVIAHLF